MSKKRKILEQPHGFYQSGATCWAYALASWTWATYDRICFPIEFFTKYTNGEERGVSGTEGRYVLDQEGLTYTEFEPGKLNVEKIFDLINDRSRYIYWVLYKPGISHCVVIYGVEVTGEFSGLLSIMDPFKPNNQFKEVYVPDQADYPGLIAWKN
ncbi:MAG TPA: papain-like cysteine protease family protein [Pyrinomonadaceae bacterium]|jgi:hypothetical protein